MQAYAILDGGGVKGAALAGCLKAAEELGIEFVAYGGTSAGSIVALLASIGCSADEISRMMVDEVEFKDFLDDGGVLLKRLKSLPERLKRGGFFGTKWIKRAFVLWRERSFIKRLDEHLGLYSGHRLRDFLLKKIQSRHDSLKEKSTVTGT